MNEVIELSKQNNYFEDALSDIKSLNLEYINEWMYIRQDYDSIPLRYMTGMERENLIDTVIQDLDLYDYYWEDIPIDEVESELYEYLLDELLIELEREI